jgi:hypothetical protein
MDDICRMVWYHQRARSQASTFPILLALALISRSLTFVGG